MKTLNYRKRIKEGNTPVFAALKKAHSIVRSASFPAPRMLYGPIFFLADTLHKALIFMYRQFWVIPRYKMLMTEHGRNLTAGIFAPFVRGQGRVHVGDRVKFYGKTDFIFGSITDQVPELHIGDRTTIGHGVMFDVSSTLVIGRKCLVARFVTFQDCNGHHVDSGRRWNNDPLTTKQVRPITIGDNVWIGTSAYILPGTHIGSGSVIGAGAVVKGTIPENSLVMAPPPAVQEIRPRS